MQINEVISLSDKQLNEQLRITSIRDKLQSDIHEYFVGLRLSTLLLENDEELIGRAVAWLAGNEGNYRGVTGEIIGIGTGGNAGKVMVRGGLRNGTFPISPDKLLDPVDRTSLNITLGSNTPAAVAPDVDDDDDGNRRRFKGGLAERPARGWLRQSFSKLWMWQLAAALGLTIDWGVGEEDDILGQGNFGDEVLVDWWNRGRNRLLVHPSHIVAGAMPEGPPDGKQTVPSFNTAQNDEWDRRNEEEYHKYVEIAYGTMISMYFVAITTALFGPAFKVVWGGAGGVATFARNPKVQLQKVWPAIKKFIRYCKSIRNVFSAASTAAVGVFTAGVGGVVAGIVSFIVGTAAIWAVEIILKKTGAADAALEWLVFKLLVLDVKMADTILPWPPTDIIISMGQRADQLLNQGADAAGLNANDEANIIRDAQRLILANPATDVETERAVRALVPADANGSGSGTTPPVTTTTTGDGSVDTDALGRALD
jgi:hypothetical protein